MSCWLKNLIEHPSEYTAEQFHYQWWGFFPLHCYKKFCFALCAQWEMECFFPGNEYGKVRTQMHSPVSQICDKGIEELNWLESL